MSYPIISKVPDFDRAALAIIGTLVAADPAASDQSIQSALHELLYWHRADRAWLAIPLSDGQIRILSAGCKAGFPDSEIKLAQECWPLLAIRSDFLQNEFNPVQTDGLLSELLAQRATRSFAALRVGQPSATPVILAFEANSSALLTSVCAQPPMSVLGSVMLRCFLIGLEKSSWEIAASQTQHILDMFPASSVITGPSFAEIPSLRLANSEVREARTDEDVWQPGALRKRAFFNEERPDRLLDQRGIEKTAQKIPRADRDYLQVDIGSLVETEQSLQYVIESARVGAWQLDLTTMVIKSNNTWAKILGYLPNEIGMINANAWASLAHPEDASKMQVALVECVSGLKNNVDFQVRMRHRAGSFVWLRTQGWVTRRAPNGKPVVITGFDLDITSVKACQDKQEQMTVQLHASIADQRAVQARFNNIAEVSRSWVWEQDVNLRFTYLSQGYGDLTGNDPADLIGKTRDEMFGQSAGIKAKADWARLSEKLARREPFSDFVYKVKPNDSTKPHLWFQVGGKPVFDAEGHFCGYQGIGRDVTILRDATECAEQANRAKSAFLTTMSHEIRTPLFGILGTAEVLENQIQNLASLNMVRTIRESGELLLTILNHLLDLAKIEEGTLTLEKIAFSPADQMKCLEPIYALQAQGKGLTFLTEMYGCTDLLRVGDPTRLMQVLHNLLANAIKFTNEGQIRLILKANDTENIECEIRDTGIGMTKDQARRVFEPFEQAENGTNRRYNGAGLGLGVVRGLIKQMGGQISVASTPNRGTRMRFVIPLPFAESQVEPKPLPAAAELTKLPTAGCLQGVSALVADDNAANRLIIKSMLSAFGMTFTMVADGAQAVDAWKSGKFDLLLLDISMPVVDGPTALAQIRAIACEIGVTRPKAIAITANAMAHHVDEYLGMGFDFHVAKPVKKEVLRTAIERLVFDGAK